MSTESPEMQNALPPSAVTSSAAVTSSVAVEAYA